MAKPPPDDAVGAYQWRRITASVKPLRAAKVGFSEPPLLPRHAELVSASMEPKRPDALQALKGRGLLAASTVKHFAPNPLNTAWERDLRNGQRAPDMTIDLHGHSLASAYSHLSRSLDRAVAAGVRIILVVAGKARGGDEAPRGAIRRELVTWLVHSPYAGRILAVRNAHPRHGGAGALYVVLKKPKRVQ